MATESTPNEANSAASGSCDCSAWSPMNPSEAGVYWLRIVRGADCGTHLVAMELRVSANGHRYLVCQQSLLGSIDKDWSVDAGKEVNEDIDELENGSLWSGPLAPPQ